MASATVTSKGQVTIPKEVREALGLKAGDRITFVVGADGRVTIEPATVDLLSLAGILEPRRKGVTVEEMNEAIRRAGTRG
jgi:AbrB family looped-hinge helix DNA binding protein